MKHRVYAFILTISLVFIFSGCKTLEKSDETETDYVSVSMSESEIITETNEATDVGVTSSAPVITETQSATTPESLIAFSKQDNQNLKPLELLGCYINDNGNIVINYNEEKRKCSPDTYRKYFFGKWNGWIINENSKNSGYLIIDDSEKNNCPFWLSGGFEIIDDRVIVSYSWDSAGVWVFWIDIYEPTIMYYTQMYGNGKNQLLVPIEEKMFNITSLSKLDNSTNEPEKDYISKLKVEEISQKYGIERNMLCEIDYLLDNFYCFKLDYYYCWSPIYLISEEANKLIFKSKLMHGYGFYFIDVYYTIEVINDKWKKTIEINETSVEQARERIKNDGVLMNIY